MLVQTLARSLAPDIVRGLLSIEQVSYVCLVIALNFLVYDEFQELRTRSKNFTPWLLLAFLGFAGLSAFFSMQMGLELVLMALALSAGLVLGMMSPTFALCFFVGSLFLRPWEIVPRESVLQILPRALFLVTLASWILNNFRHKVLAWVWRRELAVFVAFGFWVYLSIFRSPQWLDAHQSFVDNFSRSLILFVVILNIMKSRRQIVSLVVSLTLASGTVAALTAYRMIFDPVLSDYNSRASMFGMIGDPNDISALLLLALPMGLHFVGRLMPRGVIRYGVSAALIGVTVWLITLTQSRGAMVALLALCAVWGVAKLKHNSYRAAFIGALFFAALALQATLHRSAEDLEASRAGRLNYWKAGFQMALRNPILGVGYGAFPLRFSQYVDVRFSEAGPRTAHSSWVLLMAETGFVGLSLFLALYYLALLEAWRLKETDSYLFFSLVGYGAAMSFLSHSYLIQPYVLLAIVFAMAHVTKRDSELSATA